MPIFRRISSLRFHKVDMANASSPYACLLFTIVLNDKHNHKNLMGIGRFHKEGIETFKCNKELYLKSVVTDLDEYDDIQHIIPLSEVSEDSYKEFIEFYFTKNMRFYSIDVWRDNIAFSKPSGWYERT